jgi:hypothetical protein
MVALDAAKRKGQGCCSPTMRPPGYLLGIAAYRLKIREASRVRRERYDDLEQALTALEEHGRELSGAARPRPLEVALGRVDPLRQVIARVELSGPGRLHAGLQVRGDGSADSYSGRVYRQPVVQQSGESPYDALRRTLEQPPS